MDVAQSDHQFISYTSTIGDDRRVTVQIKGGIVRYNGKYVGKIVNFSYVTDRKPRHFFKIWQGFGISTEILETLKDTFANKVVIRYFGRNFTIYKSDLKDWLDNDKSTDYIDDTDGYPDRQRILPTLFMTCRQMD